MTEEIKKLTLKEKIINLYYELKPIIITWLNNLVNSKK